MHYFPEVTSTMHIARDMARRDCPHFTVVVAGRQQKGRGRLGRTWLSSEGGLYFTVVTRPHLSPVLSHRINFTASLVLARTLQNMLGVAAGVKWPNDILVDGKKIAGLLSEMEAEDDAVSFVNIGIGLNVNNDPSRREPKASSLKKILGREIARKEILAKFLDAFENRIQDDTFDRVIAEWKQYTVTLNAHVKVVTTRDVSEGVAIDVDENGALILELADGSTKRVIYGDCFHQDT